MVFKGIKQEYIYIADTEYDHMKIIQSAGFIFQRVDERNDIYQLAFSFNFYIKKETINRYVQSYTGITPEFLEQVGMSSEEFKKEYDELFDGIDPEDTMFVSHGITGDLRVLKKSGVQFSPKYFYCTYKNGKRVLDRQLEVSLTDLAEDAGYHLYNGHDAYADAFATAVVFSYLRKLEWQDS